MTSPFTSHSTTGGNFMPVTPTPVSSDYIASSAFVPSCDVGNPSFTSTFISSPSACSILSDMQLDVTSLCSCHCFLRYLLSLLMNLSYYFFRFYKPYLSIALGLLLSLSVTFCNYFEFYICVIAEFDDPGRKSGTSRKDEDVHKYVSDYN
ncbi:hypothetical protein ARMGADRAFT_692277 [Armillaria gallica]|uniref:Uncharacterized protein n=1 Tax=Armillaria gallica TaxID=47427 RepID=A0A2H3DQI8_ARMGA|nr:hypothetical protein ARMGADRAFT_692277 [Armillaria gallica]